MKLIAMFAFALLVASLQGCAAIEKSGLIENQISCAVDGSNGLINSMYGPLGITSKIKQSQADVICANLKPSPALLPAASAKPALPLTPPALPSAAPAVPGEAAAPVTKP